ncbi:MotB family protein [Rhizobium sp. TRM95796]|uniref:MotB family protein n=1 Tax=Rhizobium sp. TRM95796 TaxID=2979862 RepID=UPI0021E89167|nr:MotB family protein [Rhizobium sp. TRM95796]MCV3766250.1 MotB family protein [Rhizobium sp. TRM95796]
MSENESHHHGKNEIIIIKRHGGGHEGAHGGAWKIAYADFMTAMMAFFLIMWLVNAANEKTKAAVASYFNPIKLTDSTPAEKGLKKPNKQAQGENTQDKSDSEGEKKAAGQAESEGTDETSTAGEQIQYSEADYFENPYAVITEIAQETDDKANVSAKGDGGAQSAGPATGADGGEAFRDPFDPDFWTQQVEVSQQAGADPSQQPAEISGLPGDGMVENAENIDSSKTGEALSGDRKGGEMPSGEAKAGEGLTDSDGMKDKAGEGSDMDKHGSTDKIGKGKSDMSETGKTDKKEQGQSDQALTGKSDKDKNGKADQSGEKVASAAREAENLEKQLKQELKGKVGYLAEGLIVTPAEGGLLISISDQVKTPMFQIGSSIPTKETVVAIDQIGKLLKGRPGQIAIRGHTDARPFKAVGYDNWRLSADRAQSAYFILKRAGVQEARVSQISGFADKRLRIPEKPLDAGNRRIEILVQATEG